MRVLVVEDDAVVGTDIVMLLEEWGHVADGPHSKVEDALKSIESFGPDIGLLDIELKDGETSEAVAEALHARGRPIVCLTGYASRSYKANPVFASALRLEKPITPEALRSALSLHARRDEPPAQG